MGPTDEYTVLVTVRARHDPDFPGNVFVTLRRQAIGSEEPEQTVRKGSIDEAVTVVRRWLEHPGQSRARTEDDEKSG